MNGWVLLAGYVIGFVATWTLSRRWVEAHGRREFPALYETADDRQWSWETDRPFVLLVSLTWPIGLPMACWLSKPWRGGAS